MLIISHFPIQEMIRFDTDFINQNMTISQKGADKMRRKKSCRQCLQIMTKICSLPLNSILVIARILFLLIFSMHTQILADRHFICQLRYLKIYYSVIHNSGM